MYFEEGEVFFHVEYDCKIEIIGAFNDKCKVKFFYKFLDINENGVIFTYITHQTKFLNNFIIRDYIKRGVWIKKGQEKLKLKVGDILKAKNGVSYKILKFNYNKTQCLIKIISDEETWSRVYFSTKELHKRIKENFFTNIKDDDCPDIKKSKLRKIRLRKTPNES